MATQQRTVDFLLDQLREAGPVSARKMFGEYALYLHGKVFALVADDQLFLKPTEASDRLFPGAPMGPPYPGAKLYVQVPEERWDDGEWLSALAAATARNLPPPKPKPKPKRNR
ncbi:MAG: TfoX/Sxy family protein [Acidobacteria bacterium]|nr:TfoX/Sxy family protein [Acidobacteriota bacterium]